MTEVESELIIPKREEAIKLLKRLNVQPSIIHHMMAVSRKATKIAENIANVKINLQLVKIGALLHDIGRSVTHGFNHGIIGADIIRNLGYSEDLARIAEIHILGGLSIEDAKAFGLPPKDYQPRTLEEKIVCLADKYFTGTKEVSIEERFQHWIDKWGKTKFLMKHLNKVENLEDEIMHLICD